MNLDSRVNAADYVPWRKTSGSQVEYDMWRKNFGRSFAGATSASSTVPEPSAAMLALIAAAMMIHAVRIVSLPSTGRD
jgi:hypothetical protein